MAEDEVIALAASGNEAAQHALFDDYWPRVFRLATMLLGDSGDAEEVAQDAFVYAFRNLHRFDSTRAPFWAWLRLILVSRCRNRRRGRRLRTISLDTLEGMGQAPADPCAANDPARWLEELGRRRAFWTALQQVSCGAREALVLRYYEGLPYLQLGEALDCSAEAARARVAYGKAQLRHIVSRLAEDAAEWQAWIPKERPADG